MVRSVPSLSHRISIEPLSQALFAPFGTVISNPANNGSNTPGISANQGSATKYPDVTDLTSHYNVSPSRKPARATVSMFVCKPRQLQSNRGPGEDKANKFSISKTEETQSKFFRVEILERHPFTSQTFIPMGLSLHETGTTYLVIVAPTLSLRHNSEEEELPPPCPHPAPRPRRSLREGLTRARPNPFTNDFTPTTTPPAPPGPAALKPKGSGMPDLRNLKAFIARGDQAVTYGPGTWHAPMVALGERPVEFLVVQYANGVPLEDCQEVDLKIETIGQGVVVVIDDGLVESAAKVRAKL